MTQFEFCLPTAKSMPTPKSISGKQPLEEPSTSIFSASGSNHGDEAFDLETVKREVHLENANRLSEMTEEEILNERRELLKKLGMFFIR